MDEKAVREADEPRTNISGHGHGPVAVGDQVRGVQSPDRRAGRAVRVERNPDAGRPSDRRRHAVAGENRTREQNADAGLTQGRRFSGSTCTYRVPLTNFHFSAFARRSVVRPNAVCLNHALTIQNIFLGKPFGARSLLFVLALNARVQQDFVYSL